MLAVEKYSNYELNGFLTILTERWDESAAQAIVETFHTLTLMDNKSVVRRETKEGAPMTGHTDQFGDVTINDKEVKETIRGENQENVARIGYYKVKQTKFTGQVFVIIWHHFWASDPTTISSHKAPAPYFGVEYSKETLRPIALIRWDYVQKEGPEYPSFEILLRCFFLSLYGLLIGKSYTFTYEDKSYEAYPRVIFGKSSIRAAR